MRVGNEVTRVVRQLLSVCRGKGAIGTGALRVNGATQSIRDHQWIYVSLTGGDIVSVRVFKSWQEAAVGAALPLYRPVGRYQLRESTGAILV